jgi:hypothetical protein
VWGIVPVSSLTATEIVRLRFFICFYIEVLSIACVTVADAGLLLVLWRKWGNWGMLAICFSVLRFAKSPWFR